MKQHVALVLALMVMAAAAHKVEVKRQVDKTNDYDDDLEEWDASEEEELWGPHEQRHRGINVLDKDGRIVVSDPSDRVLRALVRPDQHTHSDLTLEKVKAMYQKLEAAEREAEIPSSSNPKGHLQEMLAREQEAYKQQQQKPEEDSLVKRVLSVFW